MRLFKPQFFGKLLHLLQHLILQVACIAFNDFSSIIDIRLILLSAHARLAYATAVLDVVFEAYLIFALLNLRFIEPLLAGPKRVELMNDIEYQIYGACPAVRTEVFAMKLIDSARFEYSRIGFSSNADTGITFAILEENIIVRLITLNQIILEQKSILLGVDHYIFDISNIAHERVGLKTFVLFIPITIYPPLQVFSFAYVNNHPVRVEVLIYSRTFWQTLKYAFYIRIGFHYLRYLQIIFYSHYSYG